MSTPHRTTNQAGWFALRTAFAPPVVGDHIITEVTLENIQIEDGIDLITTEKPVLPADMYSTEGSDTYITEDNNIYILE